VAQDVIERKGARPRPEPQAGPCTIGKGISVRGKVSGREELVIAGRIEGSVAIEERVTVEAGAVVEADVEARELVVQGELRGDVTAQGAVTVAADASVVGYIRAGTIVLVDGARFVGSIDMVVELPEGLGKAPRPRARA
jgi:cytoskeletal protein CcmA (bactofilin family)